MRQTNVASVFVAVACLFSMSTEAFQPQLSRSPAAWARPLAAGRSLPSSRASTVVVSANQKYENSERLKKVAEMQERAAEEGTDKKGLIVGAAVVAVGTVLAVVAAIGSGYDGTLPLLARHSLYEAKGDSI